MRFLRSTFFRRLFTPYLVLICLAIAGVGAFAAVRLRSTYMSSHRDALRDDLQLVSDMIDDDLAANRVDELNTRIKRLGDQIACRITVVAEDGTVLADNWADPAHMVNHRDRPEIVAAMSRREAYRTRPSETIHNEMLYLARRMEGAGGRVYYLRLALLLRELNRELWMLYAALGAFAVAAMLAAAFICYRFARRNTAPILELTQLAEDLARGHLDRRAASTEPGEVGVLATTFNTMASSMQSLLERADSGRNELLTIISSIPEGVIATDAQQRILVANDAAAAQLGFNADQAVGKPFWQVVRNDVIIKAAAEVLGNRRNQVIQAGVIGGRQLEVFLCTHPAGRSPQGLIMVVHDTTQAVRYQELRKEFVANVSHELRTPLTVIKGFVETLKDGAMRDPVKGPEYLSTIERHTEQITNLVDDLLELSKLESQPDVPKRGPVDIVAIAQKSVELLMPAAQKKSQSLTCQVSRVPLLSGNADYLERAISNLIDNAIKYTPDGGRIVVSVNRENAAAAVQVSDNGIGIPEADVPRIFERFYRVDRSRSREMGGTGLGLSIVKHVAQVHGGAVEVSSKPGQGSTFRLIIPLANAPSHG